MSGRMMSLFRLCALTGVLHLLDLATLAAGSGDSGDDGLSYNTTDDSSSSVDSSDSSDSSDNDDSSIEVDVTPSGANSTDSNSSDTSITSNGDNGDNTGQSDSDGSDGSSGSGVGTDSSSPDVFYGDDENATESSSASSDGTGTSSHTTTNTSADTSADSTTDTSSDTSPSSSDSESSDSSVDSGESGADPLNADKASIAVTTSTVVLALSSVDDFDPASYVKSIASATGIDESQVRIKTVDFLVNVQYTFDVAVDKNDVLTAVSSVMGLPKDAISVSIPSRRLSASAASRRLAMVVDVTIKTNQSSDVVGLTEKAKDTGSLATKLSEVTSTPVTLSVSKEPSISVQVVTELSSTNAVQVKGPTADALTKAYKDNTGKDLQVTSLTTESKLVTVDAKVDGGNESTTQDYDEESSGCEVISLNFACALVALLPVAMMS